jgi:hypothetical protein
MSDQLPQPTDQTPQPTKTKKRLSKESATLFLQFISLLFTAIAATSAAYSSYFAFKSWTTNAANSDDQVAAQLTYVLNELYDIEQRAFANAGQSGCPGGDCLGSLALRDTYYGQYEQSATQALLLASRITNRVTPVQWLQVSKSLYMVGKLDPADKIAGALLESNDPAIRFGARLQLAKSAFMKRNFGDGKARADEALADLAKHEHELAEPEYKLKQVQAKLTCAEMHLALGKWEDAKPLLVESHELLNTVPTTERKQQVEIKLRNLVKVYVQLEKAIPPQSFDELKKQIDQEVSPRFNPWEPTPTPGGEPTLSKPEPPTLTPTQPPSAEPAKEPAAKEPASIDTTSIERSLLVSPLHSG